MRIALEFDERQTKQCRSRLGYAFSVFCALYGHEPLVGADGGEFCISYRERSSYNTRRRLELSNSYRVRPLHQPAPGPIDFESDGERTYLYYAPNSGMEPDWLAEIFEWLSCADEYSATARDTAGRLPFEASYSGRNHLDPKVPYAAVAMRKLQRAICRVVPGCPEKPWSPAPDSGHFVINTHDVDFLPVTRAASVRRLAKNGLIALALRVPGLISKVEFGHLTRWHPPLAGMLRAFQGAIAGRNPADELSHLVDGQSARHVQSSYYFIGANRHHRDVDYSIRDPKVTALMRSLEVAGHEVGAHGSYCSLDDPESLTAEFDSMRQLGFRASGGRQHWLRFTLDRLIPALESAGVTYDCSLGWSTVMGFRAGACFAFPLYNFAEERATSFLEIPLVMMEQCLCAESQPYEGAMALLESSRKYGWGGVSVLWHPSAFDGWQMPMSIGKVYWDLLDARHESHDEWLSARQFLDKVQKRYINAGLFTEGGNRQCQPQRVSTVA